MRFCTSITLLLTLLAACAGEEDGPCTGVSTECDGFRLQSDYCLPHAVVLGHVRLKRWWDDVYDYYMISINQIFRRSFKIKAEVVRVLTKRDCGVNLQIGTLYVLGINREDGQLYMPPCSLALKYTEIDSKVRGVITKRRIDCTCTQAKCGTNTCNPTFQGIISQMGSLDATQFCLDKTGFCSKPTKRDRCCWTMDEERFSECYNEETIETVSDFTMPPIETYAPFHKRYGADAEEKSAVADSTDEV